MPLGPSWTYIREIRNLSGSSSQWQHYNEFLPRLTSFHAFSGHFFTAYWLQSNALTKLRVLLTKQLRLVLPFLVFRIGRLGNGVSVEVWSWWDARRCEYRRFVIWHWNKWLLPPLPPLPVSKHNLAVGSHMWRDDSHDRSVIEFQAPLVRPTGNKQQLHINVHVGSWIQTMISESWALVCLSFLPSSYLSFGNI